jgi:hypothetical protein
MCNGKMAADESATGAPDGIEVTEEMADAGRDAADRFCLGNSEYALTYDLMASVFRAMNRVASVHRVPTLEIDPAD